MGLRTGGAEKSYPMHAERGAVSSLGCAAERPVSFTFPIAVGSFCDSRMATIAYKRDRWAALLGFMRRAH